MNPELLFSTDDTAHYIFEGKGVQQDIFRLVGNKSLKNSRTRAKYRVSNTNNMSGMMVKLTYTFSAGGKIVSIFYNNTTIYEIFTIHIFIRHDYYLIIFN